MGIFGSDYPPGCHSVPGDEDEVCRLCGLFPEDCICPECPVCGAQGDINCYVDEVTHAKGHGLVMSDAQTQSLAKAEAEWAETNKAEAEAEQRLHEETQAYWDEVEKYNRHFIAQQIAKTCPLKVVFEKKEEV